MQELKVGEKYATLVFVLGGGDLWVPGVLTELPDKDGNAKIKAPHGEMSVHETLLYRVVTSARRATIGDVLLQNGRGVIVTDDETLEWLLAEEEGLQKELDHRRKTERAAESAEQAAKAKKRERANRARKQELRY